MDKISFHHFAAGAAAIALATGTAWAQGPATEGADAEIVVTAQKRVERLQDVPLAVSAVTAEAFLRRGQSKLQDYFATVPGLNISAQGNGQTNIAIRGVTTGQTTNPAVGIVIDDVPFGSSSALGYASRILPDLDPASLSRVEVLRGPQGTLYGASSIGGLVKFVTADPSTSELSGRAEIGVNSVAHGEAGLSGRGSINLPVSDSLAVRASGFYRRDGGYVDNVTTGEKDVNRINAYGGHVAALWTPTELLSVKLAALIQNVEGKGSSEVDANYLLQPQLGALRQARVPGADHYEIAARLFYGTINYDLGPATLTSVTSYGTSSYEASVESTFRFGDLAAAVYGVPGAALENDFFTKKLSQELRLTSSGEGPIDWMIGGFYTRERTAADQNVVALTAGGAPSGLVIGTLFPTKFRELAAFGSVTVKLGERFDIQAGGRYSGNRQRYTEIGSGPLTGDYVLAQNSRDTKFTYHITPRFRFSRDLMLYARVATGYRVGGPNPIASADAAAVGAPTEYGPDTTTNYEIGLKGSLLDRRVDFDLSFYRIDWKDIQLGLTNPANGYYYFVNGPSARSQGIEASWTLRPADGLSMVLNGAYNKARLTRDLPAGSGFGFDGDRLPFSARFTGSASVDQDIPLTDAVTGFVGGTISYVGRRLGEFGAGATNPRVVYPDYTQLDLRAGARFTGWTATVYATNLTDRRGVVGVSNNSRRPSVTSSYGVNYIRPRTIGVTLAKEF